MRKKEVLMKKGLLVVLSTLCGAIIGTVGQGQLKNKKIAERNKKVDKFKSYYNMLNQWLMLKQEGKSLAQYFNDNNIRSIAIYGMGEMGNRLYNELRGTEVEVKYALDKDADSSYSEIDVYDLESDDLEDVDAIVVTAIFAFDEIEEKINEVTSYTVINLEDVVYSL
jgi:hypothetical protein